MRVLLDTNVLLDSLLRRAPWNLEADEILRQVQPGVLDLAVTALSLANLFYVGRRVVAEAVAMFGQKFGQFLAWNVVHGCDRDLRIFICYLGSEFIDFASSEESR